MTKIAILLRKKGYRTLRSPMQPVVRRFRITEMSHDTTDVNEGTAVTPGGSDGNRVPSIDACDPQSSILWIQVPPMDGPSDLPPDQLPHPYVPILNTDWAPLPPPYTTDQPPGYDVPSHPFKTPSHGTPIIIQPGADPYIDDFQVGVPGQTARRRLHPETHNSNMGLALFTCVFCNCIMGAIAIFFSTRVTAAPDLVTSRRYARISAVISGIGVMLGTICYVMIITLTLT